MQIGLERKNGQPGTYYCCIRGKGREKRGPCGGKWIEVDERLKDRWGDYLTPRGKRTAKKKKKKGRGKKLQMRPASRGLKSDQRSKSLSKKRDASLLSGSTNGGGGGTEVVGGCDTDPRNWEIMRRRKRSDHRSS